MYILKEVYLQIVDSLLDTVPHADPSHRRYGKLSLESIVSAIQQHMYKVVDTPTLANLIDYSRWGSPTLVKGAQGLQTGNSDRLVLVNCTIQEKWNNI